jgi:hypothetical protein
MEGIVRAGRICCRVEVLEMRGWDEVGGRDSLHKRAVESWREVRGIVRIVR